MNDLFFILIDLFLFFTWSTIGLVFDSKGSCILAMVFLFLMVLKILGGPPNAKV